MNENEQINDIAKTLCGEQECGCDSCEGCVYWIDASELYAKDYRKVERGEWIKATPYSQEYCNRCGLTPKTIFGRLPKFCPHCGADMRGETK